MTDLKITPEMVQALQTLRSNVRSDETSESVAQALVVLDTAGVFAAIDRAAPACTCPPSYAANDHHDQECPQAPRCTCPRSRVTFPVPLGDDMHAQNCDLAPAKPEEELKTFTISNSSYYTLTALGFDLSGATQNRPSGSWLIRVTDAGYVQMLAALRQEKDRCAGVR